MSESHEERESWAFRKCGFEQCIACRQWFQAETHGQYWCPTCTPPLPCRLCRRVHPVAGRSCLEAELDRRGEPRGGVA